MYSSNFAAAILVNGNVLRELNGAVYLPFGSEYSIRLKNLNNTRCKVHVEIDGSPVTESSIVIDSFSSLDLERFVRNGNLDRGNRFKFIERTSQIEDYRGIGTEDGIVSVRFEFEIPRPVAMVSPNYWTMENRRDNRYGSLPRTKGSTSVSMSCNVIASTLQSPPSKEGITVEGGVSEQSFRETIWAGTLGGIHVLNFKLFGQNAPAQPVKREVTVKTKAKCKTCGRDNKATAKFCSDCGTSLTLL